jgi:hypothetical protein
MKINTKLNYHIEKWIKLGHDNCPICNEERNIEIPVANNTSLFKPRIWKVLVKNNL